MNQSPESANGVDHSAELTAEGRPRKRAKYTAKACKQCSTRKVKCQNSESPPCTRCANMHLPCSLVGSEARPPSSKKAHFAADAASNHEVTPTPEIPPSRFQNLEDQVFALRQQMSAVMVHFQIQGVDLPHSANSFLAPVSAESCLPSEANSPEGFTHYGETSLVTPADGLQGDLLRNSIQQLGVPQPNVPSPSQNSIHLSINSPTSVRSASPPKPTRSIKISTSSYPFPDQNHLQECFRIFFEEQAPFHPCVNENDFRARFDDISAAIEASGEVRPSQSSFMSLVFAVLAFAETFKFGAYGKNGKPIGMVWYRSSRALSLNMVVTKEDYSAIQASIFQAIYFCNIGRPSSGYNIIGNACRLCFQVGLHHQAKWPADLSPYTIHMRQRIFWTTFYSERRIAMSVGRPYAIRELDAAVDEPIWLEDRILLSNMPLPPSSTIPTGVQPFLSHMVAFARFAGRVQDLLAPNAQASDASLLHHDVTTWIMNYGNDGTKTLNLLQRQQEALVFVLMLNLRLLLIKQAMSNMQYDQEIGRSGGDVSCLMINTICSFDFEHPMHFRSSLHLLSLPLMTLAMLLCRPLGPIGLEDERQNYASAFRRAVSILQALAPSFASPARLLKELGETIRLVLQVIDSKVPDFLQDDLAGHVINLSDNFFSAPGPYELPLGLDFDFFNDAHHMDVPNSATSLDMDMGNFDWIYNAQYGQMATPVGL